MSETESSLYLSVQTKRTSLSDRKLKVKKKKEDKVIEIKAPSILQKIFHKKNYYNSQYYFSHGKTVDPTNVRNVLKESTPFKYPGELEQFSFKVIQKVWAKKVNRKELSLRYCDKTNERMRQAKDILSRLYVEDPGAIEGESTILDIDPEFYTIVEGRPIDKRFSMSKYLKDLRDIMRTKIMTGYRNDEVLMIEEKLLEEQRIIDEARERHRQYLDGFENFLSGDYDEAMKELRLAEQEAIKTLEKTDEIRQLYIELAAIEYSVHKFEDRWRDLKMYQKFLYYVSPISWRKNHDYINKLSDSNEEHIAHFVKYRLTSSGEIPDLEILVDTYLREIKNEQEPLLYFQKPKELKKVFRFIEIQNLNCLLHTEDMAVPMENMKDSMRNAKNKFETESNALVEIINGLSRNIEWEEECAQGLKDKAMKLINGQFRQLISDDFVLKLHIYIEDVYETCIAKNDSNFTIFQMMKAIEQFYNDVVATLDRMPQNIVKKAEKHRFAEEAKLAKLCKEAAKKITLVDRITWRLKKSLEPPYYRTTKPLVWRSTPPMKPPKPPKPPRQPTDIEREYLEFFTDYCENEDTLDAYGIDLSVDQTDLDKFSTLQVFKPKQETNKW